MAVLVAGLVACAQPPRPALGPQPPPPPPPPPATTSAAMLGSTPARIDCLTHDKVAAMLDQLRASVAPDVGFEDLQLTSAECHKRVYVGGAARFVLWEVEGYLRGKAMSTTTALPSAACIERALSRARELFPHADRIIRREAAQDPALWRDPDVGLVSFVACVHDEPTFESIATMLHETNHRISRGKCVFDFTADRDICFELAHELPPGTIATYADAPKQLDPASAAVFMRLQKLYLEQNAQSIRELLDEVMAYRIESELYAVGFVRKLYPKPNVRVFNNLPAIMALTMRYFVELEARDPVLAERELGATTANRAAVLSLFDRAEASYKTWLAAAPKPGAFERTLWDEYLRLRRAWLRGNP